MKKLETLVHLSKKTKKDILILEMKKELKEFRELKAEQKQINETLKEQSIEYENLIKSFNKTIPKDMFQ